MSVCLHKCINAVLYVTLPNLAIAVTNQHTEVYKQIPCVLHALKLFTDQSNNPLSAQAANLPLTTTEQSRHIVCEAFTANSFLANLREPSSCCLTLIQQNPPVMGICLKDWSSGCQQISSLTYDWFSALDHDDQTAK